MPIIDNLRQDINTAIDHFKANKNLSFERQQNIRDVQKILTNTNNPLEARNNLLNFLNNLSTGFISIWPFLEVNQFKQALKSVLENAKYQDTQILNAVLSETVFQQNNNVSSFIPNQDLLDRVKKLEKLREVDGKKILTLQEKMERLQNENDLLSQSVQSISEENKYLKNLNSNITKERDNLIQKYEGLIKENLALKKQLQDLSNSAKQEVKPGNAVPRFSVMPNYNYNFLSSSQASQKREEPEWTMPSKLTQFDNRPLNDKTPAVKVF
jgi:DNA repair exonuclease SbcCD ATPase subunit